MRQDDRETVIQRLATRQEIEALCSTYMHAQDRLDAALHRLAFHDDATTDYGSMRGSADAFVAWAQGLLREMLHTHHMIGQQRIDFEGDTAFGEVYFHAYHCILHDFAETDLFISGPFVGRYEERQGCWKIAHRSELIDWERVEPATGPFLDKYALGSLWGQRGDADRARQRHVLRRL